ncbi:Cilia- and flagella-associated protein isoform 2 [Schistosoma japonicum]|uniref:Cilia- and flagella-associated protein 91 n=2 Tax=Schistosoma japonicum TaxID=6182 RepID=A0A4Z2D7K1_SCHJA|nr:Cilia- and flagella-associated protein isoform 2 [Schistosoma japonicum]
MLLSKEQVDVRERKHDYLYDPLCILSSSADYERVAAKNRTDMSKMEKLFSFENLFSEIPKYRPYVWRLNPKCAVPIFVSRYFHPVDVCKELIRIQMRKGEGHTDGHILLGKDRQKYFTHHTTSLYPYLVGDPKCVGSALDSLERNGNIGQTDLVLKPPTYISRYVQTIYRDSETQTDPYTPPYFVNSGETPELLTLTSLSYKHGLPAGLFGIEKIELSRKRREIEANLKPYKDIVNDPIQVSKRHKILEDLESREWCFRNKEIRAMQTVRLHVLIQLLRKRTQRKQEVINKRLDQKWQECCAQKEAKLKTIKRNYIEGLRKLLKLRLSAKESKIKRDIIGDYAKPSSQVFAPLTRFGVFPDRSCEHFIVQNIYLSSYEGLIALEASLPRYLFEPKIRMKLPEMYTKDGFLKRDYRHQKELAELHNYMKRTSVSTEDKTLRKPRFLQKIEKPIPRPVTPDIVPLKSEESENHELATIILQKLIRGRAIQTEMYEAKDKRIELITELRSTHALLQDEQAQKKREKLQILTRQEDYNHLIHQECIMENILGRFECDSLANMLDFLSKELDRLIEERRIHALILLAERHRRIKEAEESGTRQKEERRRREQDEVFKQLVKVHEETVDGYLKSIAGLAVDSTANCLAKEEISKLAQKIEHDVQLYELNRDELKSDELAAELIHEFLIPYVNKNSYELNKERRQRKHLNAAHREIWGISDDVAKIASNTMDSQMKHQETSTLTLNECNSQLQHQVLLIETKKKASLPTADVQKHYDDDNRGDTDNL